MEDYTCLIIHVPGVATDLVYATPKIWSISKMDSVVKLFKGQDKFEKQGTYFKFSLISFTKDTVVFERLYEKGKKEWRVTECP